MFRIPFNRVNWGVSAFLMGTLFISLTAVPAYIWHFGLSPFQVILFFLFFIPTGLSITLGYHRLFAHRSFQARFPVRLACLLFGASAFESSVLEWASDHRRHHKHVDHDDDPYDITKGFFHAHMGWMLFKLKPVPPLDNVPDLQKDALVMWQHRHWPAIAGVIGFALPALIGWAYDGWVAALGGFLIAGILRVVCVQHCTFFINSLCHTIGNQPYSSTCTARDSWLMAIFTFGEGYHNYHHEFQHDYRNGVKPWHFDPTKWLIWTLNKVGLTSNLRQVPMDKIRQAMEAERERIRADASGACKTA